VVTRVVANDVAATVELRAGRHRIVSLMTAEAVADLGLRPGVLAVAAVKATSVVVEVPAR
jgi:molybdopterin-binding protein